jgi:hypothetical protein
MTAGRRGAGKRACPASCGAFPAGRTRGHPAARGSGGRSPLGWRDGHGRGPRRRPPGVAGAGSGRPGGGRRPACPRLPAGKGGHVPLSITVDARLVPTASGSEGPAFHAVPRCGYGWASCVRPEPAGPGTSAGLRQRAHAFPGTSLAGAGEASGARRDGGDWLSWRVPWLPNADFMPFRGLKSTQARPSRHPWTRRYAAAGGWGRGMGCRPGALPLLVRKPVCLLFRCRRLRPGASRRGAGSRVFRAPFLRPWGLWSQDGFAAFSPCPDAWG